MKKPTKTVPPLAVHDHLPPVEEFPPPPPPHDFGNSADIIIPPPTFEMSQPAYTGQSLSPPYPAVKPEPVVHHVSVFHKHLWLHSYINVYDCSVICLVYSKSVP